MSVDNNQSTQPIAQDITCHQDLESNISSELFPYHEDEVTYENTNANVLLSGTVSLPKKTTGTPKTVPGVVLIAGYGPFAFTQAKAEALIKTFNSQWYRFFLSFDPTSVLKRIQIPTLALNGDRNWIASAKNVFAVLANNFGQTGNNDYTLITMPNLNHMFQKCLTIKETMSPQAMKTISDWILVKCMSGKSNQ